jgi:acylaminoacyl-peptidase
VAEAPPPARTPEWCGAAPGADGKKEEGAAAPKGWRGHGEWAEDWGELNTGGWVGWLAVVWLPLQCHG